MSKRSIGRGCKIKISRKSINRYRKNSTIPPPRPPLPTSPSKQEIQQFMNDMNAVPFPAFALWIERAKYDAKDINIHLMNTIHKDFRVSITDSLTTCKILYIQQEAMKLFADRCVTLQCDVNSIKSALSHCIDWIINNKSIDEQGGPYNLKYIAKWVVIMVNH